MKIGIIGAGNVGSALADNWQKKGHEILIGARDINSSKTEKLISINSNIQVKSIEDTVKDSEVILIATPSKAVFEIANQIKDFVKDKILIDAMNTIGAKPEGYSNTYEVLRSITKSENIVKCFNSTGAENMANPNYGLNKLDMFMAGKNPNAKKIVRTLALDAGFEECYDFGGDEQVQILENFALVWINLCMKQGHGRNFGFKIIKR